MLLEIIQIYVAGSLRYGYNEFQLYSASVKTPMGLELFELRFFLRVIFTKVDLALKGVMINLSKLGIE